MVKVTYHNLGKPVPKPRRIAHFSCGAASAVATKLSKPDLIWYAATGAEDSDNERFMKDCENWFGQPVTILRSKKYKDTWDVWEKKRYLAGIAGAPCTGELKVRPQVDNQRPSDIHIFGYTADASDVRRAEALRENWPDLNVETPLIERGVNKAACLALLEKVGVEPPRTYKLGYPNANCFHGDTEFITENGVKTLRECAGKNVVVRTAGKGTPWKDATVEFFGRQHLVNITIRRNTTRETLKATVNHRWFIKNGNGHSALLEVTTKDLKLGDRLPVINPGVMSRIRPNPFGIAHGFVFGDGNVPKDSPRSSGRVVLCGNKIDMIKYFGNCRQREVPAGIEVSDIPRTWKSYPSLDESTAYLYGWLVGYFAADGCVAEGGRYTLSSVSRSHLLFVRDLAVKIGISVNGIRSTLRQGYLNTPGELYTLSFVGASLREDFFIHEHHKSRFSEQNSRDPHPWVVESIIDNGEVDDVFCVVEPITKTFVLANNVVTGNCIPCVKAQSPAYWALVRKHHPEQFQRMAMLSRSLGATLARYKGERVFIDEIPQDHPTTDPIAPACDLLCQLAEWSLI